MVAVLKNNWEKCTAKTYRPNFHFVVSKDFEKLVNNSLVDHIEKYGLFLISSTILGLLNQLYIL